MGFRHDDTSENLWADGTNMTSLGQPINTLSTTTPCAAFTDYHGDWKAVRCSTARDVLCEVPASSGMYT